MNTTEKFDFILYTDGSCYPNPGGVGGWACIIHDVKSNKYTELSGCEANSTNNKMELQAAIEGLKHLRLLTSHHSVSRTAKVVSDSEYLCKGINHWIKGWSKFNFEGKKNADRWRILHSLIQNPLRVTAEWVKGHDGHEYNERCDELALLASEEGFRNGL